MKLVKLMKDDEVLYFSNPSKAAKFIKSSRANIMQSLKFECRCKGYYVEIIDGGEVMAKDINKNMDE